MLDIPILSISTPHESVRHRSREYVRGEVHTNNIENFWSLLKRGVVGTFHHVNAQHLPLYLAEFEHRHNFRKISDGERTDIGLTKAAPRPKAAMRASSWFWKP